MAKAGTSKNGSQIECGKCSSFDFNGSKCSYFDEKLSWGRKWKLCPGYELYGSNGARKNYTKGTLNGSKRQPIDLPGEDLKNLEKPVGAIRRLCLSCCFRKDKRTRNLSAAVDGCGAHECSLWPYRFGKDPRHYSKMLSPDQRKTRAEALNKARLEKVK